MKKYTHLARSLIEPMVLEDRGPRVPQEDIVDKDGTVLLEKRAAGFLKPNGFWYEIDGAWQKWVEGNTDWMQNYKYVYSVDLSRCNMLRLRTARDVEAFHEKYSVHPPWRHVFEFPVAKLRHMDDHIDWERIAAEGHDGVELTQYYYNMLRLLLLWYNAWDCASGIIWNASKVVLTYLGEPVRNEQRPEDDDEDRDSEA